jgi:hypothetical protein
MFLILAIDQINAQILVFLIIYFIPLHVSSTVVLIIRRSDCIITAYGMVTLCRWPSGAQLTVHLSIILGTDQINAHILARPPTDSDDTRCCINTI